MDGLNTEQTMIGILVNDITRIEEVKQRICESDFEDATLSVAFRSIVGLNNQGVQITPFSIASQFGENARKTVEKYIEKISSACCSTANVLAWADIVREKSVQRGLRTAAEDMDIDYPKTDVEIFCAYLRETADEIQGFKLSREYLDDVCGQLKDNINIFYKEQYENCRINYDSERGISVPVDTNPSRE